MALGLFFLFHDRLVRASSTGRRKVRRVKPFCRSGALALPWLLLSLAWSAIPAAASSSWTIDFEAAMVTAGKNDVAIPGDTGTRFSLTDDLKTDEDVAFRVQLGRRLGQRHHLTALYAPLTLHASGEPGFAIDFNGESFADDADLRAVYKFNSYRLTWRYDLVQKPSFTFGLGLTGKVRDAYIELSDGTTTTRKDNVGFVPLLNLDLDWRFSQKLGLVLTGDAAAAPQGRAEDVLLALAVRPWSQGALHLGYRILEGGSDVDEVYSSALIHYYVFGWSQQF
jgi:hypothetical protein